QAMDLDRALTPALLSYVGIQYQYMAPHLFSHGQWEYVKNHLRILSGFYGILRPDDRVTPYRLEMQARLAVDGKKDLYDFWGSSLFEKLTGKTEEETEPGSGGKAENTPVILNLASREYSKAIEPFLTPDIRFVTCVFGVLKDGKVKIKATEAKMARGEMVRFLAENNVTDVEAVRVFRIRLRVFPGAFGGKQLCVHKKSWKRGKINVKENRKRRPMLVREQKALWPVPPGIRQEGEQGPVHGT
ncbi:MAG: YaaA family protein, partial [[Clostridium] symbiosum]